MQMQMISRTPLLRTEQRFSFVLAAKMDVNGSMVAPNLLVPNAKFFSVSGVERTFRWRVTITLPLADASFGTINEKQ